jgi:DNA polymerase-3 subunit delta
MSGRAILIVGNDTYRVSERVKSLISELLPGGQSDVGLEVIDGRVDTASCATVVASCLNALQSMSLFGSSRVVWLKDAGFLSEKGTGDRGGDDEADAGAPSSAAKGSTAAMTAWVKGGAPDGVALVVTAQSVDRRSALYKAFEAKGEVETLAISDKPREAEKQAREFIASLAGRNGLKMSGDALQALLERTGTDTQTLANEVEKLSLYSGGGVVTGRDVLLMAVPSREAMVWQLTDAMGSRNAEEAFAVLRQLLFQGESPMAIIAAIEGYLRQLAVAREILDRGWARVSGRDLAWRDLNEAESAMLDAAGKADLRKFHPFRAMKIAEQASRRSARDIRRCRQAALRTHERLVSSSLPQPLALDFLVQHLLA